MIPVRTQFSTSPGLHDLFGNVSKRSGKLPNSTMVSINAPKRIGHATATPGDVVLGRNGGVISIPAQLAEQVVKGCL